METTVDEIQDGIYRISTFLKEADFMFNQFLVQADDPLLFHCGPKGLFSSVSQAVARITPLERLRWISFGHFEADESGAMNDWLAAAPDAQVAVGEIGCMVSINDLALRPPKPLKNAETIDLGGKQVRYLATPHVPHGWDAAVMFEETTRTLFCGDLFTSMGPSPAVSEEDPVPPAFAAEDVFLATALTPNTAPTLNRLADRQPVMLALMHGPAFRGECGDALRRLAAGYAKRFTESMQKS